MVRVFDLFSLQMISYPLFSLFISIQLDVLVSMSSLLMDEGVSVKGSSTTLCSFLRPATSLLLFSPASTTSPLFPLFSFTFFINKFLLKASNLCWSIFSFSLSSSNFLAPISGLPRTSHALGLLSGTTCNIDSTIPFTLLDKCPLKGRYSPLTILKAMACMLFPSKGLSRVHSSYSTVPKDQMSALEEYGSLLITSGEMLYGLPITVLTFALVLDSTAEIPKSPTFRVFVDETKMFWDFMSLWMTLLSCMQLTASHSWISQSTILSSAICSPSFLCFDMKEARSPFSAYSIKM